MNHATPNSSYIEIPGHGGPGRYKATCPRCGDPIECFPVDGIHNLRDGCGHVAQWEVSGEPALPRLIDLPTDEACRIKWDEGRKKHGPVFRTDPLEELDYELIDALNYDAEARRRGIPMDGIRADLCSLRDRLKAIYAAQRSRLPGA